jgi:hypothetical protein
VPIAFLRQTETLKAVKGRAHEPYWQVLLPQQRQQWLEKLLM